MKLRDLQKLEALLMSMEPAADVWSHLHDDVNARKREMLTTLRYEIKNYKDNEIRILQSVTWDDVPITNLKTTHIQNIISMLKGWAVDRKYQGGVESKIYNGQTIGSMIAALKWELNRRYGR